MMEQRENKEGNWMKKGQGRLGKGEEKTYWTYWTETIIWRII